MVSVPFIAYISTLAAGAVAGVKEEFIPLRIFMVRNVSGEAAMAVLSILPPQYNLANLIVLLPGGRIRFAEDEL